MRNTETVRWAMSLVNGRALEERWFTEREDGSRSAEGSRREAVAWKREGWPLGSQASFLMLFQTSM